MYHIVDLKFVRFVECDADAKDELTLLASNRSLELDKKRLLRPAPAQRTTGKKRTEKCADVPDELLLEITIPIGG